jgi:hypothetical protein
MTIHRYASRFFPWKQLTSIDADAVAEAAAARSLADLRRGGMVLLIEGWERWTMGRCSVDLMVGG